MTIIRCPRCCDEVTAPAKASSQAVVRCPLCLEEYPLAEALRQVPPALIVLGVAGEPEPAYAGAMSAEAGGEYSVSGFATPGMLDAEPGSGAVSAPVRPSLKGTARPKRKQGGVIGSVIGIVFGGVAGIGLAILLLWWVFKNDAVGVGPTVAKYVPWIVPMQFRTAAGGGGAQQTGPSQAAVNQASTPKPAPRVANTTPKPAPDPADGGGLQMLPDLGAPLPTPPDPLAVGPLDLGPALTPDAGTRPAAANLDLTPPDPLTPPPANPVPLPGVGEPPANPKAPDLTNLIPAGTPPAPAVSPPAAAGPPTAEDFTQAVISAGDALARYDSATAEDPEAKKAMFTDMYVAIGETGRIISHIGASDAAVEGMVKELRTLLGKVAGVGGPSKTPGVRFLASTHWTERKAGDGLLVAGTVKDFKAVGSLFEITLDATRTTPLTIPVVSTTNPQDFCQLSDELVVAGRLIDDPRTNLPGYEGDHSRILFLGYSVKAPKTP